MNLSTFKCLQNLNERIQKNGFSWHYDDYFCLREALPEIIDNLFSQQTESNGQDDTCDCIVRGFTVYHKPGCKHYE